MAHSRPSKRAETDAVKGLILTGAVAATITGWGIWASQERGASNVPPIPVVTSISASTVEHPGVRRIAPGITAQQTLPEPVTVTRSSR